MCRNGRQIQYGDNLRFGWTTGACATAATAAAYKLILTGTVDDPVQISLPKGEKPEFPLAGTKFGESWAEVGVVKDAGDDPDVTNGAMIISRVSIGKPGSGVVFKSGKGVGTVTRPGLAIPVGEPAINPIPREMMSNVVFELADCHGGSKDVIIEISIPNGEKIAEGTMNSRLGILGGLSVLGTTGIVRPFSCASWIASIHRGIDVARASGIEHVAGSTGSTSERAVKLKYDMSDHALLDMGDFAGGLLKYLRRNPIPRLTIAGGPGKITKLAQGHLDLHSSRSSVDMNFLLGLLGNAGADESLITELYSANTAKQIFDMAISNGISLPDSVSERACATAVNELRDAPVKVNVLVVDQSGGIMGESRG